MDSADKLEQSENEANPKLLAAILKGIEEADRGMFRPHEKVWPELLKKTRCKK